jgi:hypothetical protein
VNLRREPTYLSSDVWRACYLLAKVRSAEVDSQGIARTCSPDEIAVELLRSTLKERYPQLLEHHKKVAKMETELLQTLGGNGK